MDDAVGELLLGPFRDIVTQANIAVDNARSQGNDEMLKAAQSLAKEGERALKRIEPLCVKQFGEFGVSFVNSAKDNEEIAQYSEQLIDLLYDFEEFVEVDGFNVDRFTELQALSRKAAPRIVHVITRMKLEFTNPSTLSEPVSPNGAGHDNEFPRVQPVEPLVIVRKSPPDAAPRVTSTSPEDSINVSSSPRSSVGFNRGIEQALKTAHLLRSQKSDVGSIDEWKVFRLPPVEEEASPSLPRTAPLTNPLQALHSTNGHDTGEDTLSWNFRPPGDGLQRGGVVSPPGSATSHDEDSVSHGESLLPILATTVLSPIIPARSPARLSPHISAMYSPTPVSSAPGEENDPVGSQRSSSPSTCLSPRLNPKDSVESSATLSFQSSTSDLPRERDSYFENSHSPTLNVPQVTTQLSSPSSPANGGLGVNLRFQDIPDGLMPVLEEEELLQPTTPNTPLPQTAYCEITLSSSFYQFRGFCQGAMEIIQGGLGVRKIKKQGLSSGSVQVAKCKSCSYELEWKQVERDLNQQEIGNFQTCGVGFRLRFLSKSHIATKHIDDQLYGCLFCVQLGRTVEYNDATVFFSQKELFSHLSRHPQPLPHIPGLTVLEGEGGRNDGRLRNNYDLYFPNPPTISRMTAIAKDLSTLPMATAVQTYRQTSIMTMRRPIDGHKVVCFAAGAKLVGIEFPERYNGEWCVGWADHGWGAFPADTIKLDLPKKSDIRMQGSSGTKAIARWKWSTKEKGEGWLRFDKRESITNISWAYAEHWCWSGTNSKGKWGLFPQSHIEPNTLMESLVNSDRASISGSERKTSGIFSKLSIRKRTSSSSGEDDTSP